MKRDHGEVTWIDQLMAAFVLTSPLIAQFAVTY